MGVVSPNHDPRRKPLPRISTPSYSSNEVDIAQRGLCPRGAASVFVADALVERRRVLDDHPDDRGRHRGGVDHIGVIRRIAPG